MQEVEESKSVKYLRSSSLQSILSKPSFCCFILSTRYTTIHWILLPWIVMYSEDNSINFLEYLRRSRRVTVKVIVKTAFSESKL